MAISPSELLAGSGAAETATAIEAEIDGYLPLAFDGFGPIVFTITKPRASPAVVALVRANYERKGWLIQSFADQAGDTILMFRPASAPSAQAA